LGILCLKYLFIQSEPGPHGFGFVGSHSQGVIAVISNSIFLTLPMGLLNFILVNFGGFYDNNKILSTL